MSTVILTPTHIGCDHTVVYRSYPHKTIVDLNHRKLFVSPDRKFIVGTVGEFMPEDIDKPEIYNILSLVLSELIYQQVDFGLYSQLATLDELVQKKIDGFAILKAFDPSKSYIFLVTKKFRFVLRRTTDSHKFYAVRLDDYAGIGSGGMIATGLLRSGMNIHDIWGPLHSLDRMTSVEHTIIPLSSLKAMRCRK